MKNFNSKWHMLTSEIGRWLQEQTWIESCSYIPKWYTNSIQAAVQWLLVSVRQRQSSHHGEDRELAFDTSAQQPLLTVWSNKPGGKREQFLQLAFPQVVFYSSFKLWHVCTCHTHTYTLNLNKPQVRKKYSKSKKMGWIAFC